MQHIEIILSGHGKEVIIGGVERDIYNDIITYAYSKGIDIDDVFTQWNYLNKATNGKYSDVFDMSNLCNESGVTLMEPHLNVIVDGKPVVSNFDPLLLDTKNNRETNAYLFDDTKVSVYFESSEDGAFVDASFNVIEDFDISKVKVNKSTIQSDHGTEVLITHLIYDDKIIEMNNTKTVFNGFNMNLYDPMEDSYELD